MPDSNAAMLEALQHVEHAILERQVSLEAAQARAEDASKLVAERRKAAIRVVTHIRNIASQVHEQARGAYLDNESIDRGTLSIGNEAVQFTGWHGCVRIPLTKILGVYAGTSRLAPRAGVPLVGRFLPGHPRVGDTLLMTVWDGGDAPRKLVAVADLENGEEMASQILARQSALRRVEADRAELARAHMEAQSAWQEARTDLAAHQGEVKRLQREIDRLQSQHKQLKQQQQAEEASERKGGGP